MPFRIIPHFRFFIITSYLPTYQLHSGEHFRVHQSETGSAQVLLGLIPSMLAVLGPSTEETSLLFIIGRRPLLALCIAAGSPAVFAMRTFDYSHPLKLLDDREDRVRPPALNYARTPIIMAVGYLLIVGAIVNVTLLGKESSVSKWSAVSLHNLHISSFCGISWF